MGFRWRPSSRPTALRSSTTPSESSPCSIRGASAATSLPSSDPARPCSCACTADACSARGASLGRPASALAAAAGVPRTTSLKSSGTNWLLPDAPTSTSQYAPRVAHTTAASSRARRTATRSRAASPTAGAIEPRSIPKRSIRAAAAPRLAMPTALQMPHCTLVQGAPAACHARPSRSRPALAAE